MRLTSFTKENYEGVYAFMRPIWEETYREILTAKQIEFLLEKYFSQAGLARYRQEGYEYYNLVNEGEERVGVLVYQRRKEGIYIDKLYLSPKHRGKGYPQQVFDALQAQGERLFLNVNQKNARAVNCYLKNGFEIAKEERIELGNGMVNVDYVMQKCKK